MFCAPHSAHCFTCALSFSSAWCRWGAFIGEGLWQSLTKPETLSSSGLADLGSSPLAPAPSATKYWYTDNALFSLGALRPPPLPQIASGKGLKEKCPPATFFWVLSSSQICWGTLWPLAMQLGLVSRCVTEMLPVCVYVNNVNPDPASQEHLLTACSAAGSVIGFQSQWLAVGCVIFLLTQQKRAGHR